MKSLKIKRLLVILLVIVLSVGLAGCKKRNRSNKEDKETTDESKNSKDKDNDKDDDDDDDDNKDKSSDDNDDDAGKKNSDDNDDKGNESKPVDDDNKDDNNGKNDDVNNPSGNEDDKDNNADDNKPDDNTGKEDDINNQTGKEDDQGKTEQKEAPRYKSQTSTNYYEGNEEKSIFNYDEYGLVTEVVNYEGEKVAIGYTFDTHNNPMAVSLEYDEEKYVFGLKNVYDGDELTQVVIESISIGNELFDLSVPAESDQPDVSDYIGTLIQLIRCYYSYNYKNMTIICPYTGDEVRIADGRQIYEKSVYSSMVIENDNITYNDGSEDNITTYWEFTDGKAEIIERYVSTVDNQKRITKIVEETKDPDVSVTLHIGYSDKIYDAATNEYHEDGKVTKWESSNPDEAGGTGLSYMDALLNIVLYRFYYSGDEQMKLIRQESNTGYPSIMYYSESGNLIRSETYYDGELFYSSDYEYWE